MKTIQITCDVKDSLPLGKLVPFQGELKSLSKENFLKLKKEIVETGFAFPIYTWLNKDKAYILGGHQRVRVLQEMAKDGWEIPDIPIVSVKAKNIKEAKRRVLQDVSQYGKIEDDGLHEFLIGAELELGDLKDFDLPDFNLETFVESHSDASEDSDPAPITIKKCPHCGELLGNIPS